MHVSDSDPVPSLLLLFSGICVPNTVPDAISTLFQRKPSSHVHSRMPTKLVGIFQLSKFTRTKLTTAL